MFNNLIQKNFEMMSGSGGSKVVPLPDKLLKMIEKTATKTLEGRYRLEDRRAILDSLVGEPLGEVRIVDKILFDYSILGGTTFTLFERGRLGEVALITLTPVNKNHQTVGKFYFHYK